MLIRYFADAATLLFAISAIDAAGCRVFHADVF